MSYKSRKISYFSNMNDIQPFATITYEQYFDIIRNERFGKRIEFCRRALDEPQIFSFRKKKLPCVTTSGVFTYRKDKFLSGAYTHIIVLDLDAKDNIGLDIDLIKEEFIELEKSVLAIHRSVSGNGLAIYIPIENGLTHNIYSEIRESFEQEYNIVLDKSTKNISRLRFISSDKDIYVNWDAVPYMPEYLGIDNKTFAILPEQQSDEELEAEAASLVDYIKRKKIDITEGYQNWFKIGVALYASSRFGRRLFHEVSSFYNNYDARKTDRLFDSIERLDEHLIPLSFIKKRIKDELRR
jgi:hypothetical protein